MQYVILSSSQKQQPSVFNFTELLHMYFINSLLNTISLQTYLVLTQIYFYDDRSFFRLRQNTNNEHYRRL